MLPWLLCAALAAAVLILCVRLWLLHRAMDELRAQLPELLGEDTNVLLGISSRDKHARALAAALNRELRELRRLRWKYMSGDRELKEAVTNISHDLRTPLTAICGYLELLEREDKSEAAARYLEYIGERAEAVFANSASPSAVRRTARSPEEYFTAFESTFPNTREAAASFIMQYTGASGISTSGAMPRSISLGYAPARLFSSTARRSPRSSSGADSGARMTESLAAAQGHG